MKGYPRWFESTLIGTSAALYVSGLLLAPTTLEMRSTWALGWRLEAASRIAAAAAHATLALAFMLLLGALWSIHMRAGWKRRQQRVSGLLLGIALLVLSASAVGVYYLADETMANFAGLSHLAIGVVLIVPFAYHAIVGRRQRVRSRRLRFRTNARRALSLSSKDSIRPEEIRKQRFEILS